MSTLAVIGGSLAVGGMVGGYLAGESAAAAQGNIAQAQERAAHEALQAQLQARERALAFSQPTPEELLQESKMLGLQEQSYSMGLQAIERNIQLSNSVDPALRKAGEEALRLLSGGESSVLSPLRQERTRERELLVSRLREQLGTGAETSSAGMEALNRFDQQTSMTMAGAQQQALGSLLGTAAAVRPNLGQDISLFANTQKGIGSTLMDFRNRLQTRQANAITGSNVDYRPLIDTAGSQYVQGLGSALNQKQLWSQVTGLGMQGLGSGLGGMGGGGGSMPGAVGGGAMAGQTDIRGFGNGVYA